MNPKAFLAAQGYSSRSNQRAEAQRPTNPRIGYISLGRSPAAEQGGSFVKSLSSLFLPLFFTLFLTACSGYKEFYKQAQGVTPEAVAVMRVAPPPPTPIVEHAQPGDSMTILDAYAKRGYIMTGNSMFKSGHPESEDSAVRQAQDVGADLVLILDRPVHWVGDLEHTDYDTNKHKQLRLLQRQRHDHNLRGAHNSHVRLWCGLLREATIRTRRVQP